MNKTVEKLLMVLLKLILLAGVLYAAMLLFFFIGFGMRPYYLGACTPLFAIFVLFGIGLFDGKNRKTLLKLAGCAAVLSAVSCLGVNLFYRYQDSITVVDNSNIDTEKYLAFREDADLVRLDHEASLRFTTLEKLPRVDGAAALFPMYSSFVNAVYPKNIDPLNTWEGPYQYHNTLGGFYFLVDENVDLVFMASPSQEQLEYAQEMDVELEQIPMGREGFVFFVNEKNPVTSLTQEQLRGIYSGEITNWKEVGGEDCEIVAYQRNNSSGSQTGLLKFMGDTPLAEAPSDRVMDLMSGIIDRVADYRNSKGAIGFSYYVYASQIKENQNLKILSVDGVEPDETTIGSGEYPLTDSFYMIVRKEKRSENLQRLIDWVLSEEGQYIVEQCGYAAVK